MAIPKPFYHERNGRVFLICPIGDENSPERKRADVILNYLVRPAAIDACGFKEVVRADLIASPGEIPREIIEHLIEDDLVVADLHGRNANVFYETGIAHTLGKTVVPISQSMSDIPSDLQQHRALIYLRNTEGLTKMQEELASRLRTIISS